MSNDTGATTPNTRKRTRQSKNSPALSPAAMLAQDANNAQVPDGAAAQAGDGFINDHDAVESGGDDDDEDGAKPADKKAGRRKIKIEFIQDKSRRHITFSKRKAGECPCSFLDSDIPPSPASFVQGLAVVEHDDQLAKCSLLDA